MGLFFLSLEKPSIILMIWIGLFNSKQLLCLHERFHDPTAQSDRRITWHFYIGILSCYWIKKPCDYCVFWYTSNKSSMWRRMLHQFILSWNKLNRMMNKKCAMEDFNFKRLKLEKGGNVVHNENLVVSGWISLCCPVCCMKYTEII